MPVDTRLAKVRTQVALQGVEIVVYMADIGMVLFEQHAAAVQAVPFLQKKLLETGGCNNRREDGCAAATRATKIRLIALGAAAQPYLRRLVTDPIALRRHLIPKAPSRCHPFSRRPRRFVARIAPEPSRDGSPQACKPGVVLLIGRRPGARRHQGVPRRPMKLSCWPG